jgi:signal peptidase I
MKSEGHQEGYLVGIKEENTRRIRELEAEFSDESIDAFFDPEDVLARRNKINRQMAARNAFARLIFIVVIAGCMMVLFLLYNPKVTYEKSMEDTIVPKDLIILSVRAYYSSKVSFGDVIVHELATVDPETGSLDIMELCTRVIGVPGDIIEIKDGYVIRNYEQLDEPYTKDNRTDGKMLPFSIPPNHYFVLGDNRQDSVDSRDPLVGLVNARQINGKVVFRLLPFSRIGIIY